MNELYAKIAKDHDLKNRMKNDRQGSWQRQLDTGRESVFARVVARRVPCVDCHNVFFVYSFDDAGRFLEVAFNEKVDAVTCATISSKVVFDSMNKPHLVYDQTRIQARYSATAGQKCALSPRILLTRKVVLGCGLDEKCGPDPL